MTAFSEVALLTKPDPWYLTAINADDFLLGMCQLGTPLDVSLVGAFDQSGTVGRGSRRDMDLPLHRDGVHSAALAAAQGGVYVERPGIGIVGLYCLRSGTDPCFTTLSTNDTTAEQSINLGAGQALIFDNTKLYHGRRGPVGDRVLLRVWVQA